MIESGFPTPTRAVGDQDRGLPEGRPPSDPGWSRGAARIAPSSAARIELEIPRVVGLTLEVGRLAVDRELATAAEHVVALDAGPERSIAATKTYTAELVALAMLSVALAPNEAAWAALRELPAALGRALETEGEASRIAADQAPVDRVVVLGRGLGYATAREWSLKLREVAGLAAEAYSAADFAHGPLTLLHPGGVVFAIVQRGAARTSLLADLERLRAERGADLLVLSDDEEARSLGRWSLPVPAGHPEWLDPIVSILPAQLHAVHFALARGLNPDRPYGLTKVTLTR